jgi:hypothetical protein
VSMVVIFMAYDFFKKRAHGQEGILRDLGSAS